MISLGTSLGRAKPRLIVAPLVAAVTLLLPTTTAATQPTATPATLNGVFASAAAGDTILLGEGDYGTFQGGPKGGEVTLQRQPGAGPVRMEVDFSSASNITIDGLTLGDVEIRNRASNITIRNSNVTGQVLLQDLVNANVLLQHNVHADWDKCDGCAEGRISVYGSDQPSGVTIRNSDFRGGMSDGIQNGATGVQIVNNSFHNLTPGTPDGVHTDAIQLYESKQTLIRGNFFYDLKTAPIMSPDGADHEVIEDNVIAGDTGGYPFVTLYSDDGSIVRHNTFADGDCMFNLPCGILRMGSKPGDPASRGTVVTDNILSGISVDEGSATLAERSHNLLADDDPEGTAEIAGLPKYVGRKNPSTYAQYQLARGSLGSNNASDGLDRGARFKETGSPPSSRCAKAKKKVKRAKQQVKRAKTKLRHADGRKATKRAQKHLKEAKAHLKKAKQQRRHRC